MLVFSLKRFSTNSRTGYRSFGGKIDCLVDFPIDGLDMTGFVDEQIVEIGNESMIYDLYAVSNHIGGMGGGHCKFY